jgi:hypothetical protein
MIRDNVVRPVHLSSVTGGVAGDHATQRDLVGDVAVPGVGEQRDPVHPRRPTMADVARRAGVSIKTVSRVVNNAPHVQQELVDRVLAAVAEVAGARTLRRRSVRS